MAPPIGCQGVVSACCSAGPGAAFSWQACLFAAPIADESPLRKAPRVVEAGEAFPVAKHLASPEYALYMGWTRAILHLSDGETLVVASPGEDGGAFMYFVNSRDLTVERFSVPDGHGSASCAVVGHDGHLYLPPRKNGAVHRLDVKEKTFTRFDVGYPADEQTWWAVRGTNGRIYYGSYPTATLGEFDPETWKGEHWQHTVPEGDSKLAHFPRTDERYFVVSFPSGRFWEIVDEGDEDERKPSLMLRGETGWPVEKWKLTESAGGVIGVSDYGALSRFDMGSDTFRTSHLPNYTPEPSHVMYLEAVAPDCVVLSPGIHEGFVILDPRTGSFRQICRMFHHVGVQGQWRSVWGVTFWRSLLRVCGYWQANRGCSAWLCRASDGVIEGDWPGWLWPRFGRCWRHPENAGRVPGLW